MMLVGLTGGIASGKSTVSEYFRREGFPVIDADLIARDVVQTGRWGYRRIVAAFGPQVLLPNGELDRAKLGAVVFEDATARRRLNTATHLPILVEMVRQIAGLWAACYTVAILDAPLLYETGLYLATYPRVVVAVEAETQLSRLLARDSSLSRAEASSRVDAQLSMGCKARRAEIVLSNEGSKAELMDAVGKTSARLRRWRGLHALLCPPGLLVLACCAVGLLKSRVP